MGALGPRLRTTVIMPLTADQRHALLLADSSRDVGQITVVIEHVFQQTPMQICLISNWRFAMPPAQPT